MKLLLVSLALIIFTSHVSAQNEDEEESTGEPQPYHYKYKVQDEEKDLYIEKEERKDENQEVKGFYTYLMPTGRIMRVEYVADKENGFVPKISYEDRNPFVDAEENEV